MCYTTMFGDENAVNGTTQLALTWKFHEIMVHLRLHQICYGWFMTGGIKHLYT